MRENGQEWLLENNNDYLQIRNQVLQSLNSPGTGTLIHPTFGIIHNVKVLSWDLDEGDKTVGVGKLKVTFGISNYNGGVETQPVTPADMETENFWASILAQLTLSVIVTTNKVVIPGVEELTKFQEFTKAIKAVYNSALATITKLGETLAAGLEYIQDGIDFVQDGISRVTDAIATVTSAVANFQNIVAQIAAFPAQLATAVTNVFSAIKGAIVSVKAGFNVFTSFFNFGWLVDADPLLLDTFGKDNRQEQQAKENDNRIKTSVNCLALTSAYTQATGLELRTVDEVDELEAILDKQFYSILENGDRSLEIVASVSGSRDKMTQFLANKRLNAVRVIDIHTNHISSRSLAYRLYGDDADANAIADLNILNGIVMNGDVKVFTS